MADGGAVAVCGDAVLAPPLTPMTPEARRAIDEA